MQWFRCDSQLIVVAVDTAQGVVAWFRQIKGGEFASVATISEGAKDAM
ncbi:hypothetical protein [Erwinia psidii]|nr:hypothetical protein [Erwinia psidii]